ncbi:class I SAM-dependent methyltransferase [Pseudaestuariivita rosea]|uniref:class I SAM-dependent methyltransferase n=1 Tax=Pseudaestuariivita rosea TaxID=2763263 RepID=UPI001ABA6CF5|nr:class I SAM-dependent methyltransferase [Pseudaestuariivita rosea]
MTVADCFPHEDKFPHEEIAERRKWILRYAKKGGVGAEFGVFRGHFSAVIGRVLKPKKLYLVDPWEKLGERFNWGNGNYTNNNQLTTAQAKADALRRTQHLDNIEIIEDFEENFLTSLTEKLDFVYLDSSHHYDDVVRTLPMIDKALAKGGVIFGDDWYSNPKHYSGVCRAVNEFVKKADYEIVAAGYDAQFCIRRAGDIEYTHQFGTPALDEKF